MRKVVSAGGLIFDDGRLLVVKHVDGYGFPKGHVEPGEAVEQAALREVLEETSLITEIVRYVGKVNRPSIEDNGEEVDKDIELFLMEIVKTVADEPEEETAWVPFAEAIEGMRHPQERAFLEKHAANLQATQ
jgi:8-oxo-dGTP pyrophosphatase MutT (NUDIX family)